MRQSQAYRHQVGHFSDFSTLDIVATCMYAGARLVLCGRSLAAASLFLCIDGFELCYGLNKLYTASTGYTGNHKPSGHSSTIYIMKGTKVLTLGAGR